MPVHRRDAEVAEAGQSPDVGLCATSVSSTVSAVNKTSDPDKLRFPLLDTKEGVC